MFKRTTAINKILALKKRIKGIQGGTSAGKTYGVLPILIDIACKTPMQEISVVAESIPHLKRGAMKDFKKIMIETGRWIDAHWNSTDSKYTFSNRSYIEFFSADDDAKLRGARRDYLYMNECNNMVFEAYMELSVRTKRDIYLDWNPTLSFWFHENLKDDANVDFLTINYTDNEACPEAAIEFILNAKAKAFHTPDIEDIDRLFDPSNQRSAYWSNWYKVYGLGMLGNIEGVIFPDWICIPDNDFPDVDYVGGLDFGFTNDPTAGVKVARIGESIFVKELCYTPGLAPVQMRELFKSCGFTYDEPVYCDHVPENIAELQQLGVYAVAARKGQGSINAGIMRLKQFKVYYTESSLNLRKELRNYMWDKDKDTGKALNKPIDAFNHLIDATRYAVYTHWGVH